MLLYLAFDTAMRVKSSASTLHIAWIRNSRSRVIGTTIITLFTPWFICTDCTRCGQQHPWWQMNRQLFVLPENKVYILGYHFPDI